MKVTGQHSFPVAPDRVWKALLDPAVLSRIMPGFERLDLRGENEFEGALVVQVGPVKGKFEGQLALSELDPPNGYRMKMNGRGAPGFVTGEGRVRLAPAAAGTELSYEFDVQIGGRIASVGQRLLDTTSRAITKQALENLGKQLEAMAQSTSSPPPVPPPLSAPAPA
ncbi:MAG: carbon monoxide dehydrogenase subunit G, partial [Planctomycetes bacterium]|nr:carbon monoxide dehydrogenase subunit G [Planctomycetota bacterium]